MNLFHLLKEDFFFFFLVFFVISQSGQNLYCSWTLGTYTWLFSLFADISWNKRLMAIY